MRQILKPTALSVALLSVMIAGPAAAQATRDSTDKPPGTTKATGQTANDGAAQTGEEQSVKLKQITVTASRREQRMQDVPISVTDISGPQLKQMQVRRLDDVRFVTPNIVIQQNTGTSSGAKVFIRGVGTDDSIFTADPSVAIYINGVYLARATGSMLDLYDVQRIEVLRGPQGTLYGRNSIGGAIRYITKKPDGKSRFKIDVNLGNYDRTAVRAKLSGKIGEDIAFDAAFMKNSRDGIVHDLSNDRMVNDQDVQGARVSFASYWGDSSFATLTIDKMRERSTPGFATPVVPGPNGEGVRPLYGSFYNTRSDIAGLNTLDQSGIVLTNNTHFENFSWRSILHYRKMHNDLVLDIDGTDKPIYTVYQDQHQSQEGYEGQFTSYTDGPVSWVGGVFLFRESNSQPTRSDIFVPGTGSTNYLSLDTKAAALYGQATWSITDDLRLIGGFRYSYEKKEFSVRQVAANGTLNFTKQLSDNWTHPDWKFVIDYNFTDDVMGYVSYATGFKSGTYNGRGTTYATITPVAQATMKAYEVGLKSTLFDGRVRLNADYYRYDYASMQLAAFNHQGVFTLTNATGALIQGFEAQLDARVTRRLTLGATVSTIDSEYQDISPGNKAYFTGLPMKNAPELQAGLRLRYEQPVADGKLTMSMQSHYTDSFYVNLDATPLIKTHAHTIVNARLAYTPRNADWSIALWGKNLTDKYYSTGGLYVAALGVATNYAGMPRTYGVEWSYRFW